MIETKCLVIAPHPVDEIYWRIVINIHEENCCLMILLLRLHLYVHSSPDEILRKIAIAHGINFFASLGC